MLTEDHSGPGGNSGQGGGNPEPGGNPGPGGPDDKKLAVEVLYNGVAKKFEVDRDELVKTLLDKAIQKFGPIQNAHLLSLYKGGTPLPDTSTLHDAGVKAGDVLLLRPNEVKGG